MAWGGDSAWMARRRREATPGCPGGGGTRHLVRRGGRAVPAGEGGGVGKASAGAGTGRERRGEGRPALGDGGDGRSVLRWIRSDQSYSGQGRNERSPLLFFSTT